MRKMYSKKQIEGMVNDSFKESNEAFFEGVSGVVNNTIETATDSDIPDLESLSLIVNENSKKTNLYKHVLEFECNDGDEWSIMISFLSNSNTPLTSTSSFSIGNVSIIFCQDANEGTPISPLSFSMSSGNVNLEGVYNKSGSVSIFSIVNVPITDFTDTTTPY